MGCQRVMGLGLTFYSDGTCKTFYLLPISCLQQVEGATLLGDCRCVTAAYAVTTKIRGVRRARHAYVPMKGAVPPHTGLSAVRPPAAAAAVAATPAANEPVPLRASPPRIYQKIPTVRVYEPNSTRSFDESGQYLTNEKFMKSTSYSYPPTVRRHLLLYSFSCTSA